MAIINRPRYLGEIALGLLLGLGLPPLPSLAQEVLLTPNFTVTITRNCPEGVVVCRDVSYVGVDRRSGAGIRLRGETVHRLCADGVTPCQFLGYRFRNGNYLYQVIDQQLQVYEHGRLILNESGTWQ